jgi:hypothetical protein
MCEDSSLAVKLSMLLKSDKESFDLCFCPKSLDSYELTLSLLVSRDCTIALDDLSVFIY